MKYSEVAFRVALGLTTAAFAFATMLQTSPTMGHGVVMLVFAGAGLFLASQALFAGMEESIRRSRQEPSESTPQSVPSDGDGPVEG